MNQNINLTEPTAYFNCIASGLSATATLLVILRMIANYDINSVNRTRSYLLASLFVADFINSSFNFSSSILRLTSGLFPGPFCTIEGFIGQMSVQASDLSTFALAFVTFYVARVNYFINFHYYNLI
jgi:hypothetical protein